MEKNELDYRRHETLQLLHPICKSLMKDVSKDNVGKLISALGQVDDPILQEIQQYILFPIQNALHLKSLSEALLYVLCEALVLILKKTEIVITVMFFDIFNPLMYCITPIDGPSKVSKMTEDTKAMVVQAVSTLLVSCSRRVQTDFYNYEHLPAIGQAISVLLSLAQTEKSRSLQVSALDCLLVLLQIGTKYGKMNEVHLGNLFAFCLPGVTMATCKIITGDSKQGHVVLLRALQVWCRIVTLVMSDCLLKKAQDEKGKLQQPYGSATKSPKLELLQSLNVKRDDSWVKMTATKLQILVRQVCKLVSDSSWKVRLSLAETTEQVLMSCNRSLSDCVPDLLETLVGLVGDDYGNVARKAQTALETFAASQIEISGERALVQILEENLYNLTTSLPRRLKMCDEEEKPAIIKLFNGYITILGPKISCVIESAPHLQRLCLALLQALELDVTNISILEERRSLLHKEPEVFAEMDSAQIWRPRKYFKHFQDEAVLSELMLACRQLGQYGNVCMLVDHLLDLYHESSVYKLAAILVINEVIVGAGNRVAENKNSKNESLNDREVLDSIIRSLLDEYLSPDNLKVIDRLTDGASSLQQPFSSSSQSLASSLIIAKQNTSFEAQRHLIKKNQAVLLVSLFLDGVAKIACVLKKDFQVHLIQSLYPLVESLGHENTYISSSAYAALVEVAVACGHTSLDSLIRNNADYLISSLSLRLRHFDENPRSPRTFCVVLRYGTHDLLAQISHSVTQLLDSVDDNYMEGLGFFMPVLLELSRAIGRWFPTTKQTKREVKQVASSPLVLDPQIYATHFVDRIRNRQTVEQLLSDGGDDHVDSQQDETVEKSLDDIEADWKKISKEEKERALEEDAEVAEDKTTEPPQHVQVVKEVLRRVKNLLAAQDGRLRVEALDIVCQACRDLADHERELLPQVHDLWNGFVPLFRSSEKFIVIKALNTLMVMVEVSGDFLRQRIMKDVIPVLVSYMEKQAQISSQSRSAYTFTSHYKLQLCVLSSLGSLARILELDGNRLNMVAKICIPYLSDMQPAALQKASKETVTDFIHLDSDAMWLLLCQSYCPCVSAHTSNQFVPVKFKFDSSNKNSLAKNITELFQMFYSN